MRPPARTPGVRVGALGVLALTLALAGCTASRTTPAPGQALVAAAGDVGNDRPHVSHDGLMVRRRVVLVVPEGEDTAAGLLQQVDLAAGARQVTLSPLPADVLDPAVLERSVGDLVLALPESATTAEAAALLEAARTALPVGSAPPGEVDTVLVHDLRFTVQAADPAGVAAAITREGILADALGSYTTEVSAHQVDVTYTGPLLSDDLIASVRRGMARPVGVPPALVTVGPRSTTGTGVDLAHEPLPATAPPATHSPTVHAHDHGAVTSAAG